MILDNIMDLAHNEVGYKEGNNNWTKYADYFDNTVWQFFNGKKQNVSWCAMFVIWLFCQIVGVEATKRVLGLPAPKDNCAAGVKYFWQYLIAKGYKVSTPQRGDIIFFGNLAHVGIVSNADGDKVYTIEGNKNNKVSECSYSLHDSYIYGYCRVDYASLESAPAPQPEPAPQPAPEPTPAPAGKDYTVKVKSVLNVRKGPGTNYPTIDHLSNGTKVTVIEQQNGFGRIGDSRWVSMNYLKEVDTAPQPSTPTASKQYTVKVKTALNVRTGPGTNYPIVKTLKNGTKVTVTETKSGFGKIGSNQWCSMSYLK